MIFRVFPVQYSPGHIVHRADMQLKLGLSRAFKTKGFDITPEQWGVLCRLWESDGIHHKILAERISKDGPNISRILNLLENKNIIYSEVDPDDKRRLKVFLTRKGKELQQKLTPIVINYLKQAFKGLSKVEIETFIRIHERLLANLESLRQ
jgi:DNA-binding MarR family transcriptional regulator